MQVSRMQDAAARSAGTAWFGDGDIDVVELHGEGFSGSRTLLVSNAVGGPVVLKSFATSAYDRVARGHRLMHHLRACGCREVPEVLVTRDGETIVMSESGDAWEAVRFVAGASTECPSAAQAGSAARMLARLHLAAASWPEMPAQDVTPPAVVRRVEHAGRLLASPWATRPVSPTADGDVVAALVPRVAHASAIFADADGDRALRRISGVQPRTMRVQAVLRDVWCGHVIFAAHEPNQVAGVIDFHAADCDVPATDLARLAGSWLPGPCGAASARWHDAVAAYESVRPLSDAERRLVPWLDATGTVCALDNWFRWCLVEDRRFAKMGRVVARVDRLIDRLDWSVRWLNAVSDAV